MRALEVALLLAGGCSPLYQPPLPAVGDLGRSGAPHITAAATREFLDATPSRVGRRASTRSAS
jgi:hypothetical protein